MPNVAWWVVAKLALTDQTIDALTAMPGDMRDAAVLMLVGRFSASASADMLKVTEQTVVRNLRSAKTYLRRHLRPRPLPQPRVAAQGRTRRATRRRLTRTSRGDPSEPSPRPSDVVHSHALPIYGAVVHDVGLGFSGSSPGRAQQLSPYGDDDTHKETDMVPLDPHAELRRQINAAIGATFGITRGAVERRIVNSDGSADASTVNKTRELLFRALEALEDGDVAFAYECAREADIELEHPGKA